jgi:tetrapyrrole methylase family protein/MazG family protein
MKEFDSLVKTIQVLRSPQGCPWDRAQKLSNYKKYLLEETYELIDEIDKKDNASIKEELGDLFLILIAIAEIFSERKAFSLNKVLAKAKEKLIARHPHVFSSVKLKSSKEVLSYWIKNKAKHKKRKTIKDRLPLLAPSLLLAEIFFKECAHIQKEKDKESSSAKIILNVIKNLNSYQRDRSKATLLAEITFNLCALASFSHLELETLLRKKIIREACQRAYPVN